MLFFPSPVGSFRLPEYCRDVDVVSVDTDSRGMTARDAYREAHRATGSLVTAGCDTIYKSVDSTLRGNLGAEINGCLDASGIECAVVAEAFTRLRRNRIELIVFYVQEEQDLDRLGKAICAMNSRVLWVGSTGLALVIPAVILCSTFRLPAPKSTPPSRWVVNATSTMCKYPS